MDIVHFLLKTDVAIKLDCIINNIQHTDIRPSLIHGFGLFSTESIGAGYALATLDGQIISYEFYQEMKARWSLPANAKDSVFMEWNFLAGKRMLVRMFKTKYSYINHSHRPHCKLLGYPPTIWSLENIEEGDELTLNFHDEPLRNGYTNATVNRIHIS
jgi:hypothetical protein